MATLAKKNQAKVAQAAAAASQPRKPQNKTLSSSQMKLTSMDYTSTPEPNKRKHSLVDPASPDQPLTEGKMRQMLIDAITPLNEKMSTMTGKLDDLHKAQDAAQKAAQEASALLQEKVDKLEIENQDIKVQMLSLEKENAVMKQKMVGIESQSRRNNLRFYGLEEKGEDCESLVQDYLMSQGFPYSSDAIERAHRMGPKKTGVTRPIIVRFLRFKDRQAVWEALGYNLFPKSQNIKHVREDFPKEIDENRAILLNVASAALKVVIPATQDQTKVRLIVDRLFINGSSYTIDTLQNLPDNLKLSTLYTPTKNNMLAFFSKHSPLSNFFPCQFHYQGVKYNCVEQYIMEKKARLCGDKETQNAVMKETEPAAQNRLCRNLQNFDRRQWETEAEDMITPALEAKFRQCKKSKDALLASGDKDIFEANARDKFWGVGLPLHSPDIWDRAKHNGNNLLGKCLQKVRQTLRDEE